MRIRRFALWSAGGLTLLLVAGFLWLWFGNLGVFKPQLERWIAERTGRELVIEGRLDINLGLETVIVAERIRFENADWSASKNMLEVGYLELRIDTFSAFAAPLTIDLINADDVQVSLEKPADRQPNWMIGPPSGAATPESAEDGGAIDVIVRQIDVDNARVVYESAERTGPLELSVGTLSQKHRDDDYLELTLDGTVGDRNFDIHAVAGTWDALLAEKDVAYEIDVLLGNFQISSKGTIDNLVAPHRPSLTFALSGPDINELLRVLRIEEGGSGDIDLTASLQPVEDGPLVLDVEGRLGRMSIEASGSLSDLQSLEQFDVVMRAYSPDLSRLLALFGFEGVPEAPFTIDLDASRQGAMLIVERAHLEVAGATFDLTARLPGFPGFDAGSASLNITGSDFARLRELLRLPGAAEGPFSLGLELDSDEAGDEIVRLALTSTLVNLEADGRVAGTKDYSGSELNFALRTDSLARIGKAYGLPRLPDLPMSGRGSFAVDTNAIRLRGPVTADIEDTTLRIEGLIARAPGLAGSRLLFGIDTPDLAEVVGMFATAEQVPPLPVDVDGEISLQRDSFVFSDVRGTLGQSSVDAEGVLKMAPMLAGSEITLSSSGPALEELLAHLPDVSVQPGTFDLSVGLAFDTDAIHFKGVDLSRPRGDLRADVTIGVSQPEAFVDFDIGARGQSVRSILPSFGEFELEDAPFSVTARGGLRGARLGLKRFDAEIGQATVDAKGDIDLTVGGSSTDFDFDLKIPSLAQLGLLKDRKLLEQDLAISARLRGDGETVRIDNFAARLGDSDLRGSLRLQKGDIPTVSFELQSELLRLAPLLEEAAVDYDPAPKFDDGRLIPNVPMPFDAMSKLNASVTVDIKQLQRDSLLLEDVTLNARLQDGAFRLHEAGFRAGGGRLRARALLEPAGGAGKATAAIQARDLSLGFLQGEPGTSPRNNIDVNFAATGTDLRSLAGNATGVLFVHSANFVVPESTILKRLYGDMLNEILATINPFAKTAGKSTIECVVLPVEVNAGMLGLTPEAFVRTDKVSIVSNASINLKSEKLEMTFRSTPRKGLTISAGEIFNPFVMVIGTLAAPRLAVDAKGSLISGGAAVATGGLSILAKATWDRLVQSGNPCDTAAKRGLEALQGRFAAFPGDDSSED
jgi:hypothetical protein